MKVDAAHITAVINGHREGLLAGPSIASYLEARTHAEANGLTIESVIVLDRPDALTMRVFQEADIPDARIFETDFGDPGMSRNFGATQGIAKYVTYLDADDLWSFNWITQAHQFVEAQNKRIIAHSEMNIVFGEIQNIWIHADSEAPGFDASYLAIGNYWDAMSFTHREIMLEYPFNQNDLKSGYGHEDWHFNNVTLLAGIPHRPVASTAHMKRRRAGSQMARCADNDVVPWITDVYKLHAAAGQPGNRLPEGAE
jgi:hypothetical protein